MCQLRHIALCFCICRLKTWQSEKPVYLIIDFSAYIFETRLSKVALENFLSMWNFQFYFSDTFLWCIWDFLILPFFSSLRQAIFLLRMVGGIRVEPFYRAVSNSRIKIILTEIPDVF